MNRVVITGLGPVTPIGIGKEPYHRAQLEGKNGISVITKFDTTGVACKFAGQVLEDLSLFLDKKEMKYWDRFVQLAVIGADLAVKDSGLSSEELNSEHVGVLIGSGIGGIESWEAQSNVLYTKGANRISPFFVPMMICNMASGAVSMRFGAQGPCSTVVTACATGTGAIGDAYRILQLGEAKVMIAGGSEAAITVMSMAGFSNMKALSFRNDSPQTASRPFNASRDGFVLGEGA
ncbi:MAG: beta-ketoacyl-[acyl-carrier-protein] synthase II, partial [Pseudopedobacter sp.]|nr:beta-ketoacyl-[acyl-carrier-protein] synthase II [Deinococcales bacterium]